MTPLNKQAFALADVTLAVLVLFGSLICRRVYSLKIHRHIFYPDLFLAVLAVLVMQF